MEKLIYQWNIPNKTIQLLYDMKLNHSYISGYILLDQENQQLKDMWSNYIDNVIGYRLSLYTQYFILKLLINIKVRSI